jgi:hypothetical protein
LLEAAWLIYHEGIHAINQDVNKGKRLFDSFFFDFVGSISCDSIASCHRKRSEVA